MQIQVQEEEYCGGEDGGDGKQCTTSRGHTLRSPIECSAEEPGEAALQEGSHGKLLDLTLVEILDEWPAVVRDERGMQDFLVA